MTRVIITFCLIIASHVVFDVSWVVSAGAAERLEKKGDFMWKDKAGTLRSAVQVLYYMPAQLTAQKTAPLVVFPGISRKGRRSLDIWKAHADLFGFAVIVPLFDEHDFPGRQYTTGGMLQRKQGVSKPAQWLFSSVDSLVTDVKVQLGIRAVGYHVFGHSAGGQFAHRLRLFGGADAQLVVVANAGWYTLLTAHKAFPYGLAGIPAYDNRSLTIALSNPLLLMLGDQDNNPNHRVLAKDQDAMEQGEHRFARGQFFFVAAKHAASDLSIDFNWEVRVVPGVAHSERRMAEASAPFIARFNQCVDRRSLALCLHNKELTGISNER